MFFDPQLNTGKELTLNISRLLSKVSLDISCAEQIVKSGHMSKFLHAMTSTHRDHSAVLIRLAYILGNLTTNFEDARSALNQPDAQSLQQMIELSIYYLKKDANPDAFKQPETSQKKVKSKYEEFNHGNLEDAMTKVVKLVANLSTDEEAASRDLVLISEQALLKEFFAQLMQAVSVRQIQTSEEFILNAISCTTNILFYDT